MATFSVQHGLAQARRVLVRLSEYLWSADAGERKVLYFSSIDFLHSLQSFVHSPKILICQRMASVLGLQKNDLCTFEKIPVHGALSLPEAK